MSRVRNISAIVFVLCLTLLQVACTGYTIRPPESVADPVGVYIIDYGDTSRLWLPEEQGGYTEWGYGDWRWYANDKKSLLYGSVVFIWPTAGTIGTHVRATGPWGSDGVLLSDLVGYATIVYEIDVERERMESLRGELHDRFDRQRSTELFNENRQMSFVKDDTSYWLGHQSSSVMAGWARELGCKVSGFSVRAHYRVKPPGKAIELETE
ncbi:MAG: hypothetical protein KDA31_08610 [Phycisphaerales bacterium]|nr:hypothetical protein [Phycisphaerales bacterium]MCB9836782.1 hypothetical protein [Phycisphaera sp.]